MPSNHSRYRQETLRKENSERVEARSTRSDVEQLRLLHRRGVKVPTKDGKIDFDFIRSVDPEVCKNEYCKEVLRLMKNLMEKIPVKQVEQEVPTENEPRKKRTTAKELKKKTTK